MLTDIRRQLVEGDYRALYAVWEEYGYETEDSRDKEPPELPQRGKTRLRRSAICFRSLDFVIQDSETRAKPARSIENMSVKVL